MKFKEYLEKELLKEKKSNNINFKDVKVGDKFLLSSSNKPEGEDLCKCGNYGYEDRGVCSCGEKDIYIDYIELKYKTSNKDKHEIEILNKTPKQVIIKSEMSNRTFKITDNQFRFLPIIKKIVD